MKLIPAITLYDPWASWVADRKKTIETRTHNRFRRLLGQVVAIHAGLHWDSLAYEMASRYRPLDELMVREPAAGVIVALAKVCGFRLLRASDSPAALCDCGSITRYGLFLSNVNKLATPQPATGHQGIWFWQPKSENYVRDADHPCGQFEAGTGPGYCEGDSHYMCRECANFQPDEGEE